MNMMSLSESLRRAAAALALASAAAVTLPAAAQEIAPVVTGGSALNVPAGTPLFVPLTISFDSLYTLTGFGLYVEYNADVLRFNEAASTVGGLSAANFVATLAGGGRTQSGDPDPADFSIASQEDLLGFYSVLGGYTWGQYEIAQGTVAVNLAFDTLPSGGSSSVTVTGFMTNATDFHDLGSTVTSVVAVVAAPVPEPTTWLMMLSGMALLGSVALRRRASLSTLR